MIDTDYERYAILRLSLHWQGKDFHVLKYFSKLAGAAAFPGAVPLGPRSAPAAPPARSLEDEFAPGFWRFRELTADTGLYLVARHGEPQAFGTGDRLGTAQGVGSRCPSRSASHCPRPAGGCAKLLKQVSLCPVCAEPPLSPRLL